MQGPAAACWALGMWNGSVMNNVHASGHVRMQSLKQSSPPVSQVQVCCQHMQPVPILCILWKPGQI